jgi:hypothetical protein
LLYTRPPSRTRLLTRIGQTDRAKFSMTGSSPSQRIGWALGFGACSDLDEIGWEIVSDKSDSNDYRLWYR